jgi:radical SAM superfamily enzyme YgiQ (UPF0313 family)
VTPHRILFIGTIDSAAEVETRYRPLWPAFLSAYVRQHLGPDTFEFRYTDTRIAETIQEFRPHLVAISSITQNFHFAEEYARVAKSLNLPVLIGGMHITSLPQALTADMDVGCIGEGEITFLELMQLYLDRGGFPAEGLRNIHGVVFREGDELVQTPKREVIASLDSLPHAYRPITGYQRRSYVYTARGCAYDCVFCSCAKHWGRVRYVSASYVLEEIAELVAHGTRVIRLADENFSKNLERLNEISQLVIQNGFHKKVKFSCWCRANDVTPESVAALKAMNVVSVKMGLESASQRMLDYLKGEVSIDQNTRAINLLKDAGLQVNADFMIGAPDETLEDIEATYQFIKRSRIDLFDVNIFSPLPGTQVWEFAKKKGLVSDHMDDWRRCCFKFNPDPARAIVLSNVLTHADLVPVFQKFERLRALRTLTALPQSPWLSELPRFVYKRAAGMMKKHLGR